MVVCTDILDRIREILELNKKRLGVSNYAILVKVDPHRTVTETKIQQSRSEMRLGITAESNLCFMLV